MFRVLGVIRRGLVPKAWAQPLLAQGRGAQPGGLAALIPPISRNLHTPASGLSAMRAPLAPATAISLMCGAVTCASLGAFPATVVLCDVSVFDVENGDESPTCEPSSIAKFSSWQDWALMMYFFMLLDILRQLFPQFSHALGLMPFLRAMNFSVAQFSFIGDLTLDILRLFQNNVATRLEFGGFCRPASNPGAAAVSVDVRFDTCLPMGYSTISPELAKLMQQNGAQAIPWQLELFYTDGTREMVKQKLALTIQLTFKGKKVVITNDFLVEPREKSGRNAITVYLSAGELSKAGLITSSLTEVQRVLQAEDHLQNNF